MKLVPPSCVSKYNDLSQNHQCSFCRCPGNHNSKALYSKVLCVVSLSVLLLYIIRSRVGVGVISLTFHQCGFDWKYSWYQHYGTYGLSLLVLFLALSGFPLVTAVLLSPQRSTLILIWFKLICITTLCDDMSIV